MRLIYHPEAEAEAAEAARYYETRSPGLGVRFSLEFEAAVAAILSAPDRWPIVEGHLRCYTVSRFPYALYYLVVGDELRILVVKHHRRHPDYWRRRVVD
ncbi:MAG: type II toxin-antitoxin system RelE/ParE family toxin [Planctomycetia bacterium]